MTSAEELYGVYAAVPLDPGVDYCDHCVTEAEVRALHTTPLRELTAGQLGPLLFSSTTTWGDIAYFRYFLPRLLELTAAGAMNDWSYPSFLPRRLLLSCEHDTPEQAAAIDRFFAGWWSRTLATWPPACDATEVYDTLTEAGVPPARLLDAWRSAPPVSGARHLAAFAQMTLTISGTGAELREWLLGPVPQDVLTAVGETDDEVLEEVTDALLTITEARAA